MIGERSLAALIASIYEAAGADFRCWAEALRLMGQVYHAPAVALGATGPRVEDVWTVAPQTDPVYNERYVSHFHRVNPIWRLALAAPLGTALTDSMMMPKHELTRTEFFNDFLEPQELGSMLGAVAHFEQGRHFHVAVQKPREFAPDDIRLYRRLAPHSSSAPCSSISSWGGSRCGARRRPTPSTGWNRARCWSTPRACVLFANKQAERLTGIRRRCATCGRNIAGPVDVRHSEAANPGRRLRAPG